ncbi:hypothetical protein ACFW4M_36440 [Streptomyces sp. NPDC058794]
MAQNERLAEKGRAALERRKKTAGEAALAVPVTSAEEMPVGRQLAKRR